MHYHDYYSDMRLSHGGLTFRAPSSLSADYPSLPRPAAVFSASSKLLLCCSALDQAGVSILCAYCLDGHGGIHGSPSRLS